MRAIFTLIVAVAGLLTSIEGISSVSGQHKAIETARNPASDIAQTRLLRSHNWEHEQVIENSSEDRTLKKLAKYVMNVINSNRRFKQQQTFDNMIKNTLSKTGISEEAKFMELYKSGVFPVDALGATNLFVRKGLSEAALKKLPEYQTLQRYEQFWRKHFFEQILPFYNSKGKLVKVPPYNLYRPKTNNN
ncbi:unnamed protein product [Phytophthora lilii]|uniref:RxLR effector protein n=1 Tax=Phytophthora lilii TaxID=2077276 RepID=A0A9W6TTS7_9STRA|nr:unnamed protein product [Phytophthora lilii]